MPGLKAALQHVDLSKDGKVSADEIAARIKAWNDSKLGRMLLTCRVTHNGQPLVGAKVRLVPEAFLGGDVKPAEGTTDADGSAIMSTSANGEKSRGVSPGFYRVEITKEGETIPAKYNTETKLGQEVALDAAGIVFGIAKFDLKY